MATSVDLSGGTGQEQPPEPTTQSGVVPTGNGTDRRGPRRDGLRRPRAVIAATVVVALIVGGTVWLLTRSGGSSSAATATQQLVTVTRGPIGSEVTAEGTIAAAQTDDLTFGSAGTVTAVDVKEGDKVTAGQVLATINSAQLAAALSSAQANLATAQAKLADDQASGASSDQVTADEATVTSATDVVNAAQQGLAGASLVATFDGTVSQVNISVGEQLSNSGTGATTVTGSASGSGRSSATLGSGGSGGLASGGGGGSASSAASSSSPAIQVISEGQYTVSLAVGTSDVARVAVGQPASVTVTTSSTGGRRGGLFAQLFGAGGGLRAAAGRTGLAGGTGSTASGGGATASSAGPSATGSVTSVSAVASASSGVAAYPVVISFDADSNAFYPGATVTGSITTQAKNDVLRVPTRAISTQNGRSVVTIATNGKLGGPTGTRTVTTGLTAGGFTEITSGLAVGDHVVIDLPSFFGGGTGLRVGGSAGGGAGGAGGAGRVGNFGAPGR